MKIRLFCLLFVGLALLAAYGCDQLTEYLPGLIPPVIDADDPVAYFTNDQRVNVGDEVYFDASGSRGTISKYQWDFGDGYTKETTEPSVVHSYGKGRDYHPSLIVVQGNTSSKAHIGLVSVNQPPRIQVTTILLAERPSSLPVVTLNGRPENESHGSFWRVIISGSDDHRLDKCESRYSDRFLGGYWDFCIKLPNDRDKYGIVVQVWDDEGGEAMDFVHLGNMNLSYSHLQ